MNKTTRERFDTFIREFPRSFDYDDKEMLWYYLEGEIELARKE